MAEQVVLDETTRRGVAAFMEQNGIKKMSEALRLLVGTGLAVLLDQELLNMQIAIAQRRLENLLALNCKGAIDEIRNIILDRLFGKTEKFTCQSCGKEKVTVCPYCGYIAGRGEAFDIARKTVYIKRAKII